MNIDVSPDGEALIFDLLGDIYRLPFAGGQAIPLTTGRAWDQAPRFSPDGKDIYFVSDREGYKNIWRLTLSDQSLQQVTSSDSDITGGSSWSQDGSRLLVGRADADTGGYSEFILQSIDPNNGNMTPIGAPTGPWIDMDTFEVHRPAMKVFSAVESSDGDVFFSEAQLDSQPGHTTRMYKFGSLAAGRTAITPSDATYDEYKPQISHNGKILAYFRQYSDLSTEIRLRNQTTGQEDVLIKLTNADDASCCVWTDSRPNFSFTPDDRQLVFWHEGKIHRVNLSNGSRDIIPFRVRVEREVRTRVRPPIQHLSETGEARVIRWPSLSSDGQTMAFAAIGYIWVMNLESGVVRRLTDSKEFETMPAISPDGLSVAYISFAHHDDRYGPGRLVVADVDGGMPRDVLTEPDVTYLVPKWSTDSAMIAVIQESGDQGVTEATVGWTRIASGRFHEVASVPASEDLANLYVYARYVGFDEVNSSLLFSFARSKTEIVLYKATLDGGAQSRLAVSTSEVGGIVPSPDLKHLALTKDDGTVWLVPFEHNESVKVSTLASSARRISNVAGYYVNWNGSRQITFGYAQNVYRHKLDRSEPESLHVRLAFDKPKAIQPIAFTGVRLITLSDDEGAGQVIESGTVVVDGARIVAIGSVTDVEIPSDVIVVDATGKTIVPGFLDTHYHRIGGGSLSAFALPNARFSDQSAMNYGVTTAWEPGGSANDGVPATVDLQEAGRITGPRWSYAAEGRVGYPWVQLTSYAAALAAVDRHRELGVTVLKEVNTPTRQQRQWLSAAAHAFGLGIVSHIVSFDGMMTRIVDGYTGGDHPYIPVPFYKDVHELLRQTGYIWTPNITTTTGAFGIGMDKIIYYCDALMKKNSRINGGTRINYSICPPDQGRATIPYNVHRVSRTARQAALAAGTGVRIGVSAHNMPGWSLHLEMWYLWKGGMPIEDVLRATTIRNAEKLGLQEELGSLELGKVADFLVLDANPLDDILNTLSLKYTVQGGVVYDSDTAQPADLNSMFENDVAAVP